MELIMPESEQLLPSYLLPSAKDSSSSISLLTAILWFCLCIFFKIMNYIVVIVPSILINALAVNYQITLSLSLILIALTLIVGFCFVIVRYKYLTGYSKETKPKDITLVFKKGMDLVADISNKKKRGRRKSTSNYLDEFLSAIKVFGYLEKPVFHELTKNMTTQKLSPDEILYLDEKLGFSIVVEGTIQVYIKVHDAVVSNQKLDEMEESEINYEKGDLLKLGNQRYQLLNEVKSGAPLSSLMNALDLFKPLYSQTTSPIINGTDKKEPTLDNLRGFSLNSSNSTFSLSTDGVSPYDDPKSPMVDFPGSKSDVRQQSVIEPEPVYPEIIARAKPVRENSDSKKKKPNSATIAIIPYLAFQRVQAKHSKATSHIVTMVLTRLYKVTMNTVHNYLGLTREIMDSEIKLNDNSEETQLPSYLHESIIERFSKRSSSLSQGKSLSNLNKSTTQLTRVPNKYLTRQPSSRYVVLNSRAKASHPGDLLSSVPLSRRADFQLSSTLNSLEESPVGKNLEDNPLKGVLKREPTANDLRHIQFSDEREETEETSLRVAIVENIFKLIGIDENQNIISDVLSSKSELSSANSSMVGLSSLMNHQSLPNVANFEHNIYDAATGRIRLDSFSSISRGGSPAPAKFYNTINQSRLNGKQSNGYFTHTPTQEEPELKRKSTSNYMIDNNFYNVKSDFGKSIDIKRIEPNTTIVEQGSFHSGLYFVIDGSLDVIHKSNDPEVTKSKKLYSVKSGGLAGYLSSVVGFRSLVSIKTPKDKPAIVAHLPKKDFSQLMDKYYFLQLPVASKLKSLLSDQILLIDYALEWCHIPAGNVLCSQGDRANGFHIVLSGRFRVVKHNNSKETEVHIDDSDADVHDYNDNLIDETNVPYTQKDLDYTILGEYGHGESIGEVEVLTASRRSNSLIAIRDSETARIPRTLFEMLSLKNPSIMIKVSRMVANRATKQSAETITSPIPTSTTPYISNHYKTITILPTVTGLPVREFADKLVHALKMIGRNVIALDQASILTHLGRHAFDERLSQLKLSGHFAYLEEEYQTIVYVCDTPLKSNWTSTCISQGDCILLLADAEDDDVAINFGDYERLLIKLKTTARTDLCLIHSEKNVVSGSTSIWLKNRIWVQGHHHIQMEINRDKSHAANKKKSSIIRDLAAKISDKTNPNIKIKLENVKSRALSTFLKRLNQENSRNYKTVRSHKNDFLRLARILSNEAVGLVLGGGGLRGISHIGVVVALEKHGIPVDLIGGTSIGSFVGGLYAMDYNIVAIYGRAKRFAKRVSSLWRSVLDLTYPVTSYITGYEFNRGIWKIFGVAEIEDFWIKYFCNSTNITNSTMDIHETGYAWRFIRASMSLAGLLPPITYNGCMLLDGGYLDNLPVMEMKKKGAKYIIAVDVGSVDDRTPMNYGDTLSGFWVLFNRWNPFSKHPNVPNMMDIQLRLAYVASVNALELSKKTPGVIYLRPPIEDYATLDFAKFDEIYHVGLAYADNLLTKWEKGGKLPSIAGMSNKSSLLNGDIRGSLYRRNSI